MDTDRLSQFFRADPLSIPNPFPVCPVLTEKTVKGAAVIENRKVSKPVFWTGAVSERWISSTRSPWTDPIGNTIGRQAIIIPADVSLGGRDSVEVSFLLSPQATVAPTFRWDLASIDTDLTE
jgi:hypothetical protein